MHNTDHYSIIFSLNIVISENGQMF